MTTLHDELKSVSDAIKQQRDEINLQLHLAKGEVKDDLEDLEEKWRQLMDKMSEISQEAESAGRDILESAKELGTQIKEGYERIKAKI
ncbi:pre-mRNA-splicing factor SPF27 family protein [Alkalimarinus sediminis]|uniref:Pre-mRNA-splicing factor SPF27 family protein n=1 Tax=Alkalimarinus sediminis TaxID=1632866 RepID=A0A9E8HIX9_9ALTE|nr:pre-mRNA-splicing factor SPF27 family protein [Alkalimarinus sediminis]UZW75510.1 pre-mRNA-splicing factor SPF27 family protein [Alkalimarinus sediminis]